MLTVINGYEALSSSSISETCLWLAEGARSICVTYRYNANSGSLKYAASIFRHVPLDSSKLVVTWDDYYIANEFPRDGVAFVVGSDGRYLQDMTDTDIANHHATTTARYKLRPARVMADTNLSYRDLLKTIRWEMCHGAGCRGPRKSRSYRMSSPVESECSNASSMTDFRVSPETSELKTVFTARYRSGDRELFIAYKGRPSTGEIMYGATIHRPDSDMESPLKSSEVDAHFETAFARLNKCPVHYRLPVESRIYKKQLKRKAPHREDIVTLIVDNIFDRRGGNLQIRGESIPGSRNVTPISPSPKELCPSANVGYDHTTSSLTYEFEDGNEYNVPYNYEEAVVNGYLDDEQGW